MVSYDTPGQVLTVIRLHRSGYNIGGYERYINPSNTFTQWSNYTEANHGLQGWPAAQHGNALHSGGGGPVRPPGQLRCVMLLLSGAVTAAHATSPGSGTRHTGSIQFNQVKMATEPTFKSNGRLWSMMKTQERLEGLPALEPTEAVRPSHLGLTARVTIPKAVRPEMTFMTQGEVFRTLSHLILPSVASR